MARKYLLQAVALLLLALLAALGYDVTVEEREDVVIEGAYRVVRVIDGDTFVASIDGEDVRVRLIGIDTPETVDPREPVECFGEEAAEAARTMLEGSTVRLETDTSQSTYDTYGRLLAYAYVESASGTQILVNEHLLREGFGHEFTFNIPHKYQREFRAAEEEARANERGLWEQGVCE